MWETIRAYLTFTRKERFGVLFLLVLISVLFILPFFFRPVVGKPDPEAYEKIKEGIRKFDSGRADSSREAIPHDPYPNKKTFREDDYSRNSGRTARAVMFYFDPNTLGANDWRRLGLSERLSQTILHYVERGGRFRRAEDLKKLYGLHQTDYERLFPYVRFADTPQDFQAQSGYYAKNNFKLPPLKKADSIFHEDKPRIIPVNGYEHINKKMEITDINLADSADWSCLPGIGPKLASRIVHFRDKLGGFYQVDQVGETFALPDSVFQKIKPYLRLNTVSLHQIDLNSATREELQSHPLIRWQLAKFILEYRRQHGGFQSIDELLQLARMDPEKYEKLKPYLIVGH